MWGIWVVGELNIWSETDFVDGGGLICDVSKCEGIFEKSSIAKRMYLLHRAFSVRGLSDKVGSSWEVMLEGSSKDLCCTSGGLIDENQDLVRNEVKISFLSFFYLGKIFGLDGQKWAVLRDKGLKCFEDFLKDTSRITSEVKNMKITILMAL